MDRNADDQAPDSSSGVSRRDLEDALKWLEEMTARQADASVTPDAASPADSPFHGLIDSESGDLPDWLREASGPEAGAEEVEIESRLDWLAKMAERESIEELPTLEWRHLAEPYQSVVRPAADDLPGGQETSPLATSEPAPDEPEVGATTIPLRDDIPVGAGAEEPAADAIMDQAPEVISAIDDAAAAGEVTALSGDDPAEAATGHERPEPETTPPAAAVLPPASDLDAAMAWIEELAASQNAPVEEVPSVADRALASKLMIEAGLSPDALDAGGSNAVWPLPDLSLLEGRTPTNPFVEAEDFADTIVLVETMAADQAPAGVTTPPLPPPASPRARVYDAPEEQAESFDDAMAFLDELAETRTPDESDARPEVDVRGAAGEMAVAPASAAAEARSESGVEELVTKAVAGAVVLGVAASSVLGTQAEDVPEEALEAETGFTSEPLAHAVSDAAADGPGGEPAPDTEHLDGVPLATAARLPDEEAEGLFPAPSAAQTDAAGAAAQPVARASSARDRDSDGLAETPIMTAERTATGMPEPDAGVPVIALAGGVAARALDATRDGEGDMEETLRALDAMALPPGRTLADLDDSLRRAGAAPARNLPDALAWLEAALRPSPSPRATEGESPLLETDLIDRMPEDPDAVLAWLERLAAEDAGDTQPFPAAGGLSAVAAAGVATQPATERTSAVEVTEADLMAMPDDPDEAMAWLESLAGGAIRESDAALITGEPAADTPAETPTDDVAAAPRSRRRRGRGRGAREASTQVSPVAAEPEGQELAEPGTAAVMPADEYATIPLLEAEPAPPAADLRAETTPESSTGDLTALAVDAAAEVAALPPVEEPPPAVAKPVTVAKRRRAHRVTHEVQDEVPVVIAQPGEEEPPVSAVEAALETQQALPDPLAVEPAVEMESTEGVEPDSPSEKALPGAEPPPQATWVDLLKPLK